MARKPVVGVMGGSEVSTEVAAMAEALGGGIAERGWVLLNGGRSAGVMAASARGAHEAGGLVVGVLPQATQDPGVSEDLDVAIFTGMGDARNAINVASSDVVVVLPGGPGTLSELALALKAGKPVVAVAWSPEQLPAERVGPVTACATVAEALEAISRHLGAT